MRIWPADSYRLGVKNALEWGTDDDRYHPPKWPISNSSDTVRRFAENRRRHEEWIRRRRIGAGVRDAAVQAGIMHTLFVDWLINSKNQKHTT